MEAKTMTVDGRKVEGYVIPMGPFNIVCIKTDAGMIGCGAFDVDCLDAFSYPAAAIGGVATVEDLLAGTIKTANKQAMERGIKAGMTGQEALKFL